MQEEEYAYEEYREYQEYLEDKEREEKEEAAKILADWFDMNNIEEYTTWYA